jgi:hypothetical protein
MLVEKISRVGPNPNGGSECSDVCMVRHAFSNFAEREGTWMNFCGE